MLLQLKFLLRDVHPAVWRRVRLADDLSIADLHQVIQLLMRWDDDHLHRFRIHGRDYGIACAGGPSFEGRRIGAALMVSVSFAGAVPLRYDFTGWQIEVRVERATEAVPCAADRVPFCIAGREPGPPDGCGGSRVYAERRRDALGWGLAADMDRVVAVLRRLADGDRHALDDRETYSDFQGSFQRLVARGASRDTCVRVMADKARL